MKLFEQNQVKVERMLGDRFHFSSTGFGEVLAAALRLWLASTVLAVAIAWCLPRQRTRSGATLKELRGEVCTSLDLICSERTERKSM